MLCKFHKNRKGFTLIELMIVVVIIGILAALAIPRFMRATTKSKQSEGKAILKQIYVMERAYRQEHDVYHSNLNTIGVEIDTANARYDYVLSGVTDSTFLASAGADLDDDADRDSMTIDQTGTLTQVLDDATN